MPHKRWCNGIGYRTNEHFWNAICKYGWDAFTHEILFKELTLEEASVLEKKLIGEYKTTDPKHGYNIALGGFGGGHPTTEETKQKISKAKRGKPCSEEQKKKLSELNRGKIPTNLDDIHRKNKKCVDQFDVNGNYIATHMSIEEAAQTCKANKSAIGNCCNGRYKTAGGFIWKFATTGGSV